MEWWVDKGCYIIFSLCLAGLVYSMLSLMLINALAKIYWTGSVIDGPGYKIIKLAIARLHKEITGLGVSIKCIAEPYNESTPDKVLADYKKDEKLILANYNVPNKLLYVWRGVPAGHEWNTTCYMLGKIQGITDEAALNQFTCDKYNKLPFFMRYALYSFLHEIEGTIKKNIVFEHWLFLPVLLVVAGSIFIFNCKVLCSRVYHKWKPVYN